VTGPPGPAMYRLVTCQSFRCAAGLSSDRINAVPNIELREDGAFLAAVLDRLRDREPERFEALNEELGRLYKFWQRRIPPIFLIYLRTTRKRLSLPTRWDRKRALNACPINQPSPQCLERHRWVKYGIAASLAESLWSHESRRISMK
jgi:hypothetical protein